MRHPRYFTRGFFCLVLAVVMLLGLATPAMTLEEPDGDIKITKADTPYVSPGSGRDPVEMEGVAPMAIAFEDDEPVRVSIILDDPSALERAGEKGLTVSEAVNDAGTKAYQAALESAQDKLQNIIEIDVLGDSLDVVWNMTLSANIISANVPFGKLDDVRELPGVKDVIVETRYESALAGRSPVADPMMATSGKQIGSTAAYYDGYTGAGSRIAIIDTGLDPEHISFNADALKHSFEENAAAKNMSYEDYIESLDLLTAEKIQGYLDDEDGTALHISDRGAFKGEDLYLNIKLPLVFNYIDGDTQIDHVHDSQGEHGSHVSGIAAANKYVPNGEGGFDKAIDTVYVQGVAPDAQILVMKVFGKNGGAYDSDYMAAIDDALTMEADAINLSLGSPSAGFATTPDVYQDLMDLLPTMGAVLTISAGNAGSWASNTTGKKLYAEDVNVDSVTLPGSYANALTVASVNNAGYTYPAFTVGGEQVIFSDCGNAITKPKSLNDLNSGEYGYILIDGYGTADEIKALESVIPGKFVICSRGGNLDFVKKFQNLTSLYSSASSETPRAVGLIVYDNESGPLITADFRNNYSGTKYAFATTDLVGGRTLKEKATPVYDESGKILYYEGKLTIDGSFSVRNDDSEYYTMSSFSSWGVPGDLSLKPDITAPGGNIYSVWGANTANGAYDAPTQDHDKYEQMSGTSMAAPQVAGMAAVVAQYVKEKELAKTPAEQRALVQSLLMSTAVPMTDEEGRYYPVIQQGAGLANVGNAVSAHSYIMMDEDATKSASDGKVKAELKDDPERKGHYSFSFILNDLPGDGESREYTLSAEIFTQALGTDEKGLSVLEAYTQALKADVTWTVDNEVLAADDSDKVKVTLPANGQIKVNVDIVLTDEQKKELTEKYPNGAYVQGYIFVGSTAADGEINDQHSIPVLAFFGSWAESRMFDVGTWTAYYHGAESKTPYLGSDNQYKMSNNVGIIFRNDPTAIWPFGGNPVEADASYDAGRNAINSVNGDKFAKVYFAPIRNIAAIRLTMVNETTGETLVEKVTVEQLDAAYYYSGWEGVRKYVRMDYAPKAEDMKEGDKLTITLTALPEYYVDADGNVDWSAATDGSSMSISCYVDNTAPELLTADKVVIDEQANTITVTASDNRYVAAVRLLDRNLARVLASARADLEAGLGAESTYTLDISEVYGQEFYIEVMDYAHNTSLYHVKQKLGKPQDMPEVLAFNHTAYPAKWVSVDLENPATNTEWLVPVQSGTYFYGAAMIDKLIFASSRDGYLWVIDGEDLSNQFKVGKLNGELIDESELKFGALSDMTYNPKDNKVYGILDTENSYDLFNGSSTMIDGAADCHTQNALVTVDPLTAKVTEVGMLPSTNTLACDANGTFYTYDAANGKLCSFTLTEGGISDLTTLIHFTEWDIHEDAEKFWKEFDPEGPIFDQPLPSFLFWAQAMEVNPKTNQLVWLTCNGTNRNATKYFDITVNLDSVGTGEIKYTNTERSTPMYTGLVFPDNSKTNDKWYSETNTTASIELSETSVDVVQGSSKQLTAEVYPWNAADKSLIWYSDDTSIATVDENGRITAVFKGETTIHAKSRANDSVVADCKVTVGEVEAVVSGAVLDVNADPHLFTWDLTRSSNFTITNDLEKMGILSAAYDSESDTAYVMDGQWYVHKLDANGNEIEVSENAAEYPMWDMTYSALSTEGKPLVWGIYDTMLMLPTDPMNITSAHIIDFTEALKTIEGLAAIASAGLNEDGEEVSYILDTSGNIWTFRCKINEATGSYLITQPVDIKQSDKKNTGLRDLGLYTDSSRSYLYYSMVMGEDGALYLAAYTEFSNVSELFHVKVTPWSATASRLGSFGESNWPVVLFKATTVAEPEPEREPTPAPAPVPPAVETVEKGTGDDATTETIAEPGATVRDGEASSTVSSSMGQEMVNQAEKNDSDIVVIAPKMPEGTKKATVTIPGSTITRLGQKTEADLKVETPAGSVTIPNESFEELGQGNVKITLEKNGDTFTFNVEVNGESVPAVFKVQVPLKDGEVVVVINKDGAETIVSKSLVEDGNAYLIMESGETVKVIDNSRDFEDVGNADWFTSAVTFVSSHELFFGTSVTEFSPNEYMRRADLVTVLWRLESTIKVSGSIDFTDVPDDVYYAGAVGWASANGIINGTAPGVFDPMEDIKREDMVTIIYRYVKSLGLDNGKSAELDIFEDGQKVDPWALEAMKWAAGNGIIQGNQNKAITPREKITRAEVATILERLVEYIVK